MSRQVFVVAALLAAVAWTAQIGKQTVKVPMRDEVELATDIYGMEGGRRPVLLMRTPYNKNNAASTAERYAAAGRTCVETNHNWSRLLERLEDLVAGGDRLASETTRPPLH